MKSIEVSEASGVVLDWMVAQAEGGYDLQLRSTYGTKTAWQYTMMDKEYPERMDKFYLSDTAYSTDWVLAGSIIEREGISVIKLEHTYGVDKKGFTTSKRIPVFGAVIGDYFDTDQQRNSYGESWGEIYYMGVELVTTGHTQLIAAMRCYVASKLGNTVEIPDELI